MIAAPARGSMRRASRPATLAATVFHSATLATDASVVVVSATTNGHAPPRAISAGAVAAAAVRATPTATSTVADGARPVIASYASVPIANATAWLTSRIGIHVAP